MSTPILTEHTPILPWHVVEHSWEEVSVYDAEGPICTLNIGDCDEDTADAAEEQMKAHAALIVRAVNSHSDLIAALAEIAEGCINRRPGHVDESKNRTKAHIEEIARAALAKAEALS